MIKSRAFWIGLLGSAAFLGIFFFAIIDDFDQVVDVFASANYIYAIPSLAFYTLALWFRTVRWRYLLKPFTGESTRRGAVPSSGCRLHGEQPDTAQDRGVDARVLPLPT